MKSFSTVIDHRGLFCTFSENLRQLTGMGIHIPDMWQVREDELAIEWLLSTVCVLSRWPDVEYFTRDRFNELVS